MKNVSKEPVSAFAIYSEKLKQKKKSKPVIAGKNDKTVKKYNKPELKMLKKAEIGNILMQLAENSKNADFGSMNKNIKEEKTRKTRTEKLLENSQSKGNSFFYSTSINNVKGENGLIKPLKTKNSKPEEVLRRLVSKQQKIMKESVIAKDNLNKEPSTISSKRIVVTVNNTTRSVSNKSPRLKKRKRSIPSSLGWNKHDLGNTDIDNKDELLTESINPFLISNVEHIEEVSRVALNNENKTLNKRTKISDKKNKTGLKQPKIRKTTKKQEIEKHVLEGNRLFNWLILPVPETDFMVDYWEKEPLFIQREGNRNYFSGVLNTPAIDAMLRDNIVCFTKHLDVTSYVDGVRETHNLPGRAQANVVWDFYSNGCSIRLLNPQAFIPEIHAVNATLQEYFGCFVGSNVYLTPPNSQGFAPHFDDIEAFILQIEGKKHWKVYPPRNDQETLPRFSSPNFSQEEIGEPFLDVTLEPGDLLYFPRGWIHQAATVDGQHSLHITLSVYQRTAWIDLLEKALPLALKKAAAEDVEFRRGLPRDYLGLEYHGSDAAKKAFTSAADSLMSRLGPYLRLSLGSAVDQMGAQFMHDALPPVFTPDEKLNSTSGGGLKMVENGKLINRVELDLTTQIKLIRPNICRLVKEEGEVRLYHCLDNPLEYHAEEPQFLVLPPEGVDVITHLAQRHPAYTEIAKIPHPDQEALLTLVSDLWDAGLLISRDLQSTNRVNCK